MLFRSIICSRIDLIVERALGRSLGCLDEHCIVSVRGKLDHRFIYGYDCINSHIPSAEHFIQRFVMRTLGTYVLTYVLREVGEENRGPVAVLHKP